MKKLLTIILACLSLVATSSLSACSSGPDNRAEACSSYQELRHEWISAAPSNSKDPFASLQGKVAELAGVLSVWKKDGGSQDPLFSKLSSYAGDSLLFVADPSPANAKTYFAFEDKQLRSIEKLCGLKSTYVAPLTIHGGCWNNPGIKAELQQKFGTKWSYEDEKPDVSKTAYCSQPGYPWGVDFVVRRSTVESTKKQNFRIIWTSTSGNFANGRSFNTSCPVEATRALKSIEVSGSNCS